MSFRNATHHDECIVCGGTVVLEGQSYVGDCGHEFSGDGKCQGCGQPYEFEGVCLKIKLSEAQKVALRNAVMS